MIKRKSNTKTTKNIKNTDSVSPNEVKNNSNQIKNFSLPELFLIKL